MVRSTQSQPLAPAAASLLLSGCPLASAKEAEERAARTVNKERREHGETTEAKKRDRDD